MSLPGSSVPLVTCPYCHVANPLGQFLIKIRGNGFSWKRFKCPSCGKVGERSKDNQMLKLDPNFPETEKGEHYDDDEWEKAQGGEPDLEPDDDLDDAADTDDFDEPDEDY